jgi:hypothetical protein
LIGRRKKTDLHAAVEFVIGYFRDAIGQWPEMRVLLTGEVVLDVQPQARQPRAEWPVHIAPIMGEDFVRNAFSSLYRGVTVDFDHASPESWGNGCVGL